MVTPLPFPAHASDAALIAALRKGHPGAARALHERYADLVSDVLAGIFGPAEDLTIPVRRTFTAAVRGIEQLADPEGLRAWLLRHSVDVARRELRRRRWRAWRARLGPSAWWPPARAAAAIAADVSGGAAVSRSTYDALRSLPVDEHVVLALRLLEGMSFVDTCAACRSPMRTVRRLLLRAERRFRAAARRQPELSAWLAPEPAVNRDVGDVGDTGDAAAGWPRRLTAGLAAPVSCEGGDARHATTGRLASGRERQRLRDGERDVVVSGMLAAVSAPRPRPWPPLRARWPWMVVGCAAAAVVVGGVLVGVLAVPAAAVGPSSKVGFSVSSDGEAAAGAAHGGRLAEWLVAAPNRETTVAFSEGSRLRLGPRGRGRVLESGPARLVVLLESGDLHVDVQRTGRRWVLHAGPVEVVTGGADLDLRWDPESQRVRISLHAGRAVLSGACASFPRSLAPGDKLEMVCPAGDWGPSPPRG